MSDEQQQQNGEANAHDALQEVRQPSAYERLAFASAIAASASVLGVGMISIGSLFSVAIDTLGFLLLSAHWIIRVLIVVGGFAVLTAILDVLIPKQQVTIAHTTHALHVLVITTVISALLIFVTFLVIAMR